MVQKRKRTGKSNSGPASVVAGGTASKRPSSQPAKRTAKGGRVPAGGSTANARVAGRDVAGYSREETADRVRSARKVKNARRRRWPFVVAGALVSVLLVAGAVFSWDRWLRYDDVAELQGEWQVHGSDATMVIDGESIHLTEDVAYPYALDTGAKTIEYAFGNAAGSGRYRFSLDRSQLVIMDGTGYSWWSTLLDDIGWMAGQAADAVQGRATAEPPSGEGVTVLDRVSHDAAAVPREAGDGADA